MPRHRPSIVLVATIAWLCVLLGADWPQFRGPDGTAVSSDQGVPTTWSATENIAWKTALPGAGSASPIVVGDKIVLTCYSGYGVDQDQPGEPAQLVRHLVCLARADGKILWDKTDRAKQPETEYKGFILNHGYSSATPASDGRAVYAFFGRSGVFAYSLAGDLLWQADVGQGTHAWGSASSPILYKNLVLVNASVESQSLVALDKATGKQVWSAGQIKASWSTPALVTLADGKQELAVSLRDKVLGLDPADGKQLWECAGVPDYVCSAVIAHAGVVYVTGGRKPFAMAIRAGGRGEVTASHKLWEVKKTPKVATPVYHDGLLSWIDNRGAVTCLKADSGAVVYEEKLQLAGAGDKVYASLVLADGKLFGVTRHDGVLVLAAGPKFQKLAQNHLDDSLSNATPAVADGRLLVRSDRFLYCIGK